MEKKRVGILFGGKSAEHEISLQSARSIIRAIDRERYDILLIAIDKGGRWGVIPEEEFFRLFKEAETSGGSAQPSIPSIERFIAKNSQAQVLPPVLQQGAMSILLGTSDGSFLSFAGAGSAPMAGATAALDVIFPVLHGTYGEDGTVQGLLKLAGVPFVGAGVLGSAVCMDKDVMKRLLRDSGIPGPRFLVYDWSGREHLSFERVKGVLGLPFFVKPTNLGSSVGISKAKSEGDFQQAVDLAFRYDTKIIIEEFIRGRELECSVLGNETPVASVPGEVKPLHEFYSYAAKYIDDKGALLEIPARITKAQKREVQELAVRSYKVLCCEGMARVDFFLADNGRVLVNELNTIPGFTRISMYPKLWEESGISLTELIHRLIELALERHRREQKVQTHYLS